MFMPSELILLSKYVSRQLFPLSSQNSSSPSIEKEVPILGSAISGGHILLLFCADTSDLSLLNTGQVTVLGLVLKVPRKGKVTPPARLKELLV